MKKGEKQNEEESQNKGAQQMGAEKKIQRKIEDSQRRQDMI